MKNQQECPERTAKVAGTSKVSGASPAKLTEFTVSERRRLARLRRQVAAGERSDTYPTDKRQEFVRWLVEHGKLSDS